MPERSRFIHRTLKPSPSQYESALSRALTGILGKGIHDLAGIVAALNETQLRFPNGGTWTEENFAAEMERLGAYPNSTGAPLGQHPVTPMPPGTSTAESPRPITIGGRSHAH